MTQLPYQILVSGKVQGVGFRHFTAQTAQRLALKGWVRNLRDGRVEALVDCSEENLATFINFIRQGPPLSNVDNIEYYKVEGRFQWDNFYVEEDGEAPWSAKE